VTFWARLLGRFAVAAADVRRKVKAYWPAPGGRLRAEELLGRDGLGPSEQERIRVQLAVLKLADGNLDRLAEMIVSAERDWRDVIASAEYPEQSRALWATRADLTRDEASRLAEILKRDREQYMVWLRQ